MSGDGTESGTAAGSAENTARNSGTPCEGVGTFYAVVDSVNNPAASKREQQKFSSVIWSRNTAGYWVSDCGRYEVSPRYTDGHFAWRGREVSTDRLICSSLDPDFVKYRCESHAASVAAEAT